MLKFNSFIFLLLIQVLLFSAVQAKMENDSLLHELYTTKQTSEKIKILVLLASSYTNSEPAKAFDYAEQAMFLSESIGFEKGKADAKLLMGYYYKHQLDYNQALTLIKESLDNYKEIDDKFGIAKSNLELGKLYQKKFEYDKSLDVLFKAMEIFTDLNKNAELAETYNYIGGTYYDEGKFDNAEDYYQKSLKIFENVGNAAGSASLFNNIGEIYRKKGHSQDALHFYRKSVALNNKIQNKDNLAINFDNMGNTFIDQLEFDSAAFYLRKSLAIGVEIDEKERISAAYMSLGRLYLRLNEIKASEKYFDSGIFLAKKIPDYILIREAASGLSEIYEKEKLYKEAYDYHLLLKQIEDSIFNIRSLEKITSSEMKLLFEQEHKLNMLNRQKVVLKYFIIAAGLISILLLFIMLYERQKLKIKRAKITEENLMLEKKQLKEQIDYKNRELATNVVYLVKKNELINFISEKLLREKSKFKKENQPHIDSIILSLQESKDINIWKDFENRFKEVHEEFYNKLIFRHPNLTENEKKLCALLRLNMTTKEIAAITHQNPNSIEVARTRLRKKLDLSNTEINLLNYLSNL